MISNLVSDLLDLPYCMKWSRLNFGCEALDKCTRGIVTRGITEICGVSGSGKTQLLLQLSLMTQLTPEFGGLGGSVAYICTEHVFPSKRLFEISQIFAKKYPSIDINYLANVHVEHIHNSVSFLKSEFCLIYITLLHFALSVDFSCAGTIIEMLFGAFTSFDVIRTRSFDCYRFCGSCFSNIFGFCSAGTRYAKIGKLSS